MDIGIISRRYATALLEYACENHHETDVYEQSQQVLSLYRQVPEMRYTIENPVVARKDKISLLKNAASAKREACAELVRFFGIVLENKREKLLTFILHSYVFLYRKKKKIRQGKLITAVPLPKQTLEELKQLILQKYRGRTVEFDIKVDPQIIGGAILGIGYWLIDASIAGQLKSVKRQFIEKNRRIV